MTLLSYYVARVTHTTTAFETDATLCSVSVIPLPQKLFCLHVAWPQSGKQH